MDNAIAQRIEDAEDSVGRVEKLNVNLLTVGTLLVTAVLAAASIGGMYVKIDNLGEKVDAGIAANRDLLDKYIQAEKERAYEKGYFAALAADIAELKRKATP